MLRAALFFVALSLSACAAEPEKEVGVFNGDYYEAAPAATLTEEGQEQELNPTEAESEPTPEPAPAGQGSAPEQNDRGIMYAQGLGAPQDYSKAAYWFELSAQQGNAAAQNNLGQLYEKGLGVAQNYDQASKWYLRAAEQGNIRAQYNLGVLYGKREDKPENKVLAYMWVRLAELNDEVGATAQKKKLEKEMSPAQIKEATKRVFTCLEKQYVRC